MTRHPLTGELIENESEWKDARGNWLPVDRKDEKDKDGKIIKTTWSIVVKKQKENS